ncbi:putative c6 zinc finger domain-containing protein [Erysiphe neolycopersici]|uniref:Putative c6 zinc finger domain-containing protein n=1 Tax=Erysiphe neolycopersici TaxID=212602 RepID=A0A420HGG6_9PEZI|nr:putative c6 zinc finger domain-containing protein [Erysiphe neolycopersici]
MCIPGRKSSRLCKRGVRLNFIDTTVKDPPLVPRTANWKVYFQDESMNIAAEYKGGLDLYKKFLPESTSLPKIAKSTPTSSVEHHSAVNKEGNSSLFQQSNGHNFDKIFTHKRSRPRHAIQNLFSIGNGVNSDKASSRTASSRTVSCENFDSSAIFSKSNEELYLKTTQEVLLMQVFVEEVGIWMDSMDPMKYFSRKLPFVALQKPMLLNAFLACGARHLAMVNPKYHEDKALLYYDTATTQLLRALQDPERDSVFCATTAVILNVYEIMSERAMQRMNHIAGARALIRECGWDANSRGIGAACFWLNVGMEIHSCLHFNWQVAWDPDQWGVDLNFKREFELGKEEIWVHRILYIVGKIANFRASVPGVQDLLCRDEQKSDQGRLDEWQKLKSLCDIWDQCIPRTMKPLGYLHPSQSTSRSAFPEIWLIKRATIVGRLFYHTAMILLAQVHPLKLRDTDEMQAVQIDHAHMVCGITAHMKDRGVASVALRSLAIAAECLVIRHEQEEILGIFERIRKETGWKVGFLYKDLRQKWGWESYKNI